MTVLGDDLCTGLLAVASTGFQYNQSCSSCLAIKLISLLSNYESPSVYCKRFFVDVLFLSWCVFPKIGKWSSWRLSQLFSIFMMGGKNMPECIYASPSPYCLVFHKHPWINRWLFSVPVKGTNSALRVWLPCPCRCSWVKERTRAGRERGTFFLNQDKLCSVFGNQQSFPTFTVGRIVKESRWAAALAA